MTTDWKDKLAALKDSVIQTEDKESIFESDYESKTNMKTQKTPLTVIVDKKGRNGKVATIIEGFDIEQSEIDNLASLLKKKLGVGGSVREGEILIQGDHKDKVIGFLKEKNFKIR